MSSLREVKNLNEANEAKEVKDLKELHPTVTQGQGDFFAASEHAMRHNIAMYNHTIETLGFGRYQWGMFFTCGFGFMVDQMLAISVGLVLPQVMKEWTVQYPRMLVASLYAGLLAGALICGPAVDIIGRKLVWQGSLFVVTIFTMVAAGSPNFPALAVFIAFQAAGAGGNLAIDLTVFIESLPKRKRYLLTALALWWGAGNALGGLLAWPLIVEFSCPVDATPATCSRSENMGWRYQYLLIGGLTFVFALIRVFILKMEESPKWLVTQGRFEDAIKSLAAIAKINKTELTIVAADFMASDDSTATGTKQPKVDRMYHLRGLFATTKLKISTTGLVLLWMCIGIAYPIFTLFLPVYLQSNGASLGDGSTFQTYRDYTISSVVGIFGPILAAGLVEVPFLGRRRSMAICALCAAAFAGAFTSVRTSGANIAFSSMLGFWQNAFYGVLYAYTPESLPTAHRGTGCGLVLVAGRIASLSSPFIATYTDLTTSVPIWICLGLYVAIAIIAVSLPFEPRHMAEEDQP